LAELSHIRSVKVSVIKSCIFFSFINHFYLAEWRTQLQPIVAVFVEALVDVVAAVVAVEGVEVDAAVEVAVEVEERKRKSGSL